MLSWPAGARDTDGVWAPHWYDSVWRSTGFTPVTPGPPAELAPSLEPLLEQCLPYYQRLSENKIKIEIPNGRLTGSTMLQKFDERNRDLIVNVGGRLSHRDEAGVSPFDSVVQGGDAVWEGLRLTNGRIFALDEHLARLRRSAHALGFASVPADEAITAEIIRTLAANGDAHRRAHPADPHPRRQAHLGHGPAAERLRADADRAGRVQGPGLRPGRDPADHVERAAAPRRTRSTPRSTTTTC